MFNENVGPPPHGSGVVASVFHSEVLGLNISQAWYLFILYEFHTPLAQTKRLSGKYHAQHIKKYGCARKIVIKKTNFSKL